MTYRQSSHPHAARQRAGSLGRRLQAEPVRTTRYAWYLFSSGIGLYMLLSAQALSYFGVRYDEPGGSVAAKFHPGTWLVLAGYLILLAERGNPLKGGFESLKVEPLLGVYCACMFALLFWLVSRHGGSGATNVTETLIMPFFCVATTRMLGAQYRYRLLEIILALLVVNTMIGFLEVVLHTRLIPFRIGDSGEVVEEYFRPSALLGHPLTNSALTAALLPAVLYLRLPSFVRVMLMVLLWIGVLEFGGRTAFVLATIGYGIYFLVRVATQLLRGQFNYLQLTGGALAAIAGSIVVAIGIAATGVGERIIKSLSWDGSAAVRLNIWNVFDFIDPTDLAFGISPTAIANLGMRMGLSTSEAIENFWLVIFLETGWVGYLPFLVAMGCLITWLLKSTSGAMSVAVLLFFAVSTSNNSLATKSIVLVIFMVVVGITRPGAIRE